MKRLIISSLYPPHVRGGAELVAVRRAREYQRAGDTVAVLGLRPWSGWSSLRLTSEQIDGIMVYRFFAANIFSYIDINRHPVWQRLLWHAIDLVNPHGWWSVRRVIRQWQPDEVETHIAKGIGYSTFWAVRSMGVPHRLIVHDVQYVVPSGQLFAGQERDGLLRRGYVVLCRWLIGSPAEVVSPSRWLLDFYLARRFFPHSRSTVWLAFGQLPLVTPLSLTLPSPARLLFVGQLETHKGIDWLIGQLQQDSAAAWRLDADRWQLDIVGSGSLSALLRQLTAGDHRFVWHGQLDSAAVAERLAAADVVVVPSRCYENAPTIIPLALAAAVPVVASNRGGIPELIADGVNGRLLAPPD